MNNWGTSKDELMQQFPGDSIIDTPNIVSTKSIRITAEPKQIWPWLVQMGQGQGGFYSYSRLQNLVGLKMKNADQIMPEYQDTAIGDLMKLSPQGGGEIVIMENNRALVLFADEKQMINPNIEESRFSTTWLFFIEHKGGGESKLYSRGRYKYKGILVSVMMRIFLEPITFVMERKMLKGIKRRVENTGIDNSVS
jgi:hypothetical protein